MYFPYFDFLLFFNDDFLCVLDFMLVRPFNEVLINSVEYFFFRLCLLLFCNFAFVFVLLLLLLLLSLLFIDFLLNTLDFMLVRPFKDVLMKEIVLYNRFARLQCFALPLVSSMVPARSSINQISESKIYMHNDTYKYTCSNMHFPLIRFQKSSESKLFISHTLTHANRHTVIGL